MFIDIGIFIHISIPSQLTQTLGQLTVFAKTCLTQHHLHFSVCSLAIPKTTYRYQSTSVQKKSENVPENQNCDQNTKKCPNLTRSPLHLVTVLYENKAGKQQHIVDFLHESLANS